MTYPPTYQASQSAQGDPALHGAPGSLPVASPTASPAASPVLVPASVVPDRRGVFSFLSNIERNGTWMLPRLFRTLAVLGNVELDLRTVELGEVTDIEVFCLAGNVEITVPHTVRLEVDGEATIGNFEVRRELASTRDPSAPLVRIKAKGFVGNIEIVVPDPAKTGFFQKFKARWKLRDSNPN